MLGKRGSLRREYAPFKSKHPRSGWWFRVRPASIAGLTQWFLGRLIVYGTGLRSGESNIAGAADGEVPGRRTVDIGQLACPRVAGRIADEGRAA